MKPNQTSCKRCFGESDLQLALCACICHTRPDISKKDEGEKCSSAYGHGATVTDRDGKLYCVCGKEYIPHPASEEECPHGAKGKECPVLDCGNSPHPAPKGDWETNEIILFHIGEYAEFLRLGQNNFAEKNIKEIKKLLAEREKESYERGLADGLKKQRDIQKIIDEQFDHPLEAIEKLHKLINQ